MFSFFNPFNELIYFKNFIKNIYSLLIFNCFLYPIILEQESVEFKIMKFSLKSLTFGKDCEK